MNEASGNVCVCVYRLQRLHLCFCQMSPPLGGGKKKHPPMLAIRKQTSMMLFAYLIQRVWFDLVILLVLGSIPNAAGTMVLQVVLLFYEG